MIFAHIFQDDEGDNAFHIAADAAKMIRENLEWLIIMLRNEDAAVEVRNNRQVATVWIAYWSHLYIRYYEPSKKKRIITFQVFVASFFFLNI